MDKAHIIQVDYNSQPGRPSKDSLLGERQLSPFAAAMSFLAGIGGIMAVVTFFLTRSH